MSLKIIRAIRWRAYWLPALQITLLSVAAIAMWLVTDAYKAYSLFLGGLTSILPTTYFIYRLFVRMGARAAKQIVKTFYRNEIIKLILMATLFILFIKTGWVAIVPFTLGFVFTQMAIILLSLVYLVDT